MVETRASRGVVYVLTFAAGKPLAPEHALIRCECGQRVGVARQEGRVEFRHDDARLEVVDVPDDLLSWLRPLRDWLDELHPAPEAQG